VTVIDANVLLYAYDTTVPQHEAASRWLKDLLDRGEPVGLPWVTIWAFIRIGTNSRISANPIPAAKAFAIMSDWLAQPGVVPLNPGPLHTRILERLMREYGVAGPLVTAAVLAALAIEYGASLASTDQGFRRFPELRWVNPLQ